MKDFKYYHLKWQSQTGISVTANGANFLDKPEEISLAEFGETEFHILNNPFLSGAAQYNDCMISLNEVIRLTQDYAEKEGVLSMDVECKMGAPYIDSVKIRSIERPKKERESDYVYLSSSKRD